MARITHAMNALRLCRLLPHIQVPDSSLEGKTVIVTGANSGIGYVLSRDFAHRGASVYLACRNTSKGEEAASEIIDSVPESDNRVRVLQLDTSSLKSVRAFADHWLSLGQRIDILVHNAGISDAGGEDVTAEGLGTIYCTNFLGSFVLTHLLEGCLAHHARVIFTTSTGQYGGSLSRLFSLPGYRPEPSHIFTYRPSDSGLYADTKMMQVAFCKMLQQRWDQHSPEKQLTINSFTPGYTFTPIFDKTASLPWYVDPVFWFLKTATAIATPVDQGAATGVWLATTESAPVLAGGKYYDRCVERSTFVDLEEARARDCMLAASPQMKESKRISTNGTKMEQDKNESIHG
ncbi:NAD(P)-binding protein [Polychaeton citri CBS 116435]|uniref:NAD(P)-binding protein n=1 Tax=Polychaeton citri CBS 116435 TaxID=1314669 RepID=A0A9P4QB47_9PEZI|nr:NAD(P)-binding protein [Polychaeton citri CBS 116435]